MASSPLARLIRERVGPDFSFGGYNVRRAGTEGDREAVYRLRFDVFSDERFIEPRFFPDGKLQDEFDAYSTQIMVEKDGELVATTRFVRPSRLGFPTEALFDFESPAVPRERLGEYGRLAIAGGHRGGSRAPMLGMLKAVFECMLEGGTTHVFAFLSPGLARAYASIGCVSHRLAEHPPSAATRASRAPMRGYFETQHVAPVIFDLAEMMREVGVPVERAERVLRARTADDHQAPEPARGRHAEQSQEKSLS